MKLKALGIDPSLDAAVRDYDLVEGQTLSKSAGVLLDAALAHNLGIQVGDEVRLLVRRGLVTTNVVGLVKPRSGSAVGGGGVLFMPLATAQRRFAAVGKLDRIQVVLTEGADLLAVQSQLGTAVANWRTGPAPNHAQLTGRRDDAGPGKWLATGDSLFAAGRLVHHYEHVSDERRPTAAAAGGDACHRRNSPTDQRLAGPRGDVVGTLRHFAGHRRRVGGRDTLEPYDGQLVPNRAAVD